MPLLGICLGMQWLFAGATKRRISRAWRTLLRPARAFRKRPEGAARRLELARSARRLAPAGRRRAGEYVYFTHSFARPSPTDTAALPNYSEPFAAAVERGNVMGVQFHPEKSGETGLKILRNFLEMRMLTKRIIACLDVHDGRVVKGVQFVDLVDAGRSRGAGRAPRREGADEIVLLDITATHEGRGLCSKRCAARRASCSFRSRSAAAFARARMPSSVFDAGADKVSINTAALADPSLIDASGAVSERRPSSSRSTHARSQAADPVAMRRSTCRAAQADRPPRGRVGARSRSRAARARFC